MPLHLTDILELLRQVGLNLGDNRLEAWMVADRTQQGVVIKFEPQVLGEIKPMHVRIATIVSKMFLYRVESIVCFAKCHEIPRNRSAVLTSTFEPFHSPRDSRCSRSARPRFVARRQEQPVQPRAALGPHIQVRLVDWGVQAIRQVFGVVVQPCLGFAVDDRQVCLDLHPAVASDIDWFERIQYLLCPNAALVAQQD